MEITISEVVKFRADDLKAIQKLIGQLSASASSISQEHYINLLESRNTTLLAARDDQKIIGMVTLAIYNIPTGRRAWIEDVVVDDDFRGAGLGRKLVQEAINVANTLGATSLMLTSNPARKAANQLYRTMGFVEKQTNVYTYPLTP